MTGNKETRFRGVLDRQGKVVHVNVIVDWDKLIDHLGAKAANNKTGKANYLHGAIKAKRA